MSSVFTKIVNGELPAYKIAEDDNYLAFLDILPLVEGHTLVIPKKETDLIFDIETEEYKGLWAFAQKIGKQLGKVYSEKRVAVAVVGLEVPHAHIHLLPIEKMEDMNFRNERLKFSPEEYNAILGKIKSAN